MNTLELMREGLAALLTLEGIGLSVIGVTIGIIIGGLPGFGAANVTAITLPLTLAFSPLGGMIFICGIYVGSVFSGGVPAILFNVPGTAAAAMTSIDGYPMTLKGKADIALGACVGASSFGGLLGSVLVIFLIVPLASIAIRFGPAEMALLAFVGLSIIASVVGKDLKKGLLPALLGILISAVGADPAYALPRMTFGFIELYDRFPIVPPLLGMFAIPTFVYLAKRAYVIDTNEVDVDLKSIGSFQGLVKGVKEVIKRPICVIRSSLIGFFVGALPGAGATVAPVVAYGQARIWSKDPESFGKGQIDGIIAAEAANNGITSGSIVPALALGIPGSVTTAILLSALMLHGLEPGPRFISVQPAIVFALLISFFLMESLIFPFGFLFVRLAAKMLTIKTTYLLPVFYTLCIAGVYSVRLFSFDFYLMMIFGAIALLLDKEGYPLIPLVLGFILGPIAETYYTRALQLSRGSFLIFFRSPITIVLWVILFVTLFSPFFLERMRRRRQG